MQLRGACPRLITTELTGTARRPDPIRGWDVDCEGTRGHPRRYILTCCWAARGRPAPKTSGGEGAHPAKSISPAS
jgi:hypothetical protein